MENATEEKQRLGMASAKNLSVYLLELSNVVVLIRQSKKAVHTIIRADGTAEIMKRWWDWCYRQSHASYWHKWKIGRAHV